MSVCWPVIIFKPAGKFHFNAPFEGHISIIKVKSPVKASLSTCTYILLEEPKKICRQPPPHRACWCWWWCAAKRRIDTFSGAGRTHISRPYRTHRAIPAPAVARERARNTSIASRPHRRTFIPNFD